MSADFDEIGGSYESLVDESIAFGHQEHAFYTRRKARALVDVATRHLGTPAQLKVLDVGCGVGLTERQLAGAFGELHGVDHANDALVEAARLNPGVEFRHATGDALPYEDAVFDVAFAICVLHHVEVPDRVRVVRDVARVVRPGGLVVVFEHNPRNPLTRVAVSRCEFDEGVKLLGRRAVTRSLRAADLTVVERRYFLFFPFERRWTIPAERALRAVPLGAQHYAVGRR